MSVGTNRPIEGGDQPQHHFLVAALLGLTMTLAPILLFVGAVDSWVEGRLAASIFEIVVYSWVVVLYMKRHEWATDVLAWNFVAMMLTLGIGTAWWYINDPLPFLFITTGLPVAGILLGWRGALAAALVAVAGWIAVGYLHLVFHPEIFNTYHWVSTSVSCLVIGSILGGASSKLNEAVRAVPDPVTIRDYRRERELEEQLALAERDRALGGLARAVAHDFNNLLTPIMMSAEIASQSVDDPDVRDDLSAIMLAGKEAKDLVRTVLDFQRDDAPSQRLDPASVIDSIFELLTHGAPEGVTIDADLDQGCIVHARRSDLQRIVMNLVTNSRRAVGESGRVNVVVGPHDGSKPGDVFGTGKIVLGERYVEIRVEDDGPGIDAETLEKIFEPFFTGSGGTGLGLATVRAIVDDMDGGILVDTAPGEGARFSVLLPTV